MELHEAAHAVIHVGRDADGLAFDTHSYKGVDRGQIPSPLHESLAQLLCWHCVKDNKDLRQCFEKLERQQPAEYTVWRALESVPLEKIRYAVVELRQQRIGASFQSFKSLLEG